MQDKLIEEVVQAMRGGYEALSFADIPTANWYRYKARKAIAAVRAHDAGTPPPALSKEHARIVYGTGPHTDPASHAASTAQLDAEDLVRAQADNIVALETLCQQQHEALVWCANDLRNLAVDNYPGVSEEMRTFISEKNARSVIASYAALFPKTGGAK